METRTTMHDDTSDQITRTRSRVDATNSLEILGQPSRAYPHLSTHTHTRIVSVKRVGHWVHAKRQKASICITRRTGQNTHTHTHARGKHIEGVEKDSRVGGNAFCIPFDPQIWPTWRRRRGREGRRMTWSRWKCCLPSTIRLVSSDVVARCPFGDG